MVVVLDFLSQKCFLKLVLKKRNISHFSKFGLATVLSHPSLLYFFLVILITAKINNKNKHREIPTEMQSLSFPILSLKVRRVSSPAQKRCFCDPLRVAPTGMLRAWPLARLFCALLPRPTPGGEPRSWSALPPLSLAQQGRRRRRMQRDVCQAAAGQAGRQATERCSSKASPGSCAHP